MSLKRLAEAMEGIADEAESKELDQVLSDFGGDEDKAVPAAVSTEDEDEAIVARLASATDDFEISGINSGDEDEFSQVQTNGLGREDKADYGTVAEAAKKFAFCARKLASLEEEAKKDPNGKKYMSAIAAMTRILTRKASALRIAVSDKTPFSGDLGHDGTRDEAEYGEYDAVKPAMDSEIQSTSAPWKTDKHDELGLGIPKAEGEVTREAMEKTAANHSIRLAVCLLGSKAPEDMIQAQAGEFFAQMKLASIERAIKRVAETETLYSPETTAVNPEVVPSGPVTTVEDSAKELSASTEEIPCEKKEEEVPAVTPVASSELPAPEEKKDEEFTEDEKKEIDGMTAAIVARQAKMREAAIAKAKALIAAEVPVADPVADPVVEDKSSEVSVEKPETDEIAEAVAPVTATESVPEAPVEEEELDFSTGSNEEATSIPELEACIEIPKTEVKPVIASKTEAKPKFAQTLGGTPRLASVKKSGLEILENLWVKPGEEFFG
ncbi:MAG: hypothetical protein M0R48_06705 [Candidatus Omnitrophica bacterium]|nr:hypothetical protein [Candidatus Omnitrophota bacterium]